MKLIIKEVYSNFRVDKNSKAIFVGMLQGVLEGQQLDTLDYFVVTDPEAGEFEKAVSKYAAIVGTEANVTRDGSYRAEGKALSGLGNDGRLHQTIIITSAICRQAIMEVAFMKQSTFTVDGIKYRWMTLEEMWDNENIRKNNADVLKEFEKYIFNSKDK